MNSTAHFKDTIKAYLDERANEDEVFAIAYAKEHKNLDDCINYILDIVKQSGCNGFTDEEVYHMAVNYYYDEENKPMAITFDSCRVVVNHVVILTAEEREEARRIAMERAINVAYSNIKQPQKSTAVKTEAKIQPTLFD